MAFKNGVVIGPITINTSGAFNTDIADSSNTGTVSIGNTNSGAIAIGCGTAGITVGTTANAHSSTLGSTSGASATTVQSGSGALNVTSTNGTLTVNSGTGTIGFSNDASATTVNIATGGAAKTVTLGSTSSTSKTNIKSGSGNINIPAFTAGAIVTNSSGVLAPTNGVATLVLTSNGAGVSPTFQAAPTGTGGFVLLKTLTASNSATLTFTSTYITTTYNDYLILINNVSSDNTGSYLKMLVSDDNGSTYKGASYSTSSNYNLFGSGGLSASGHSGASGSYFEISSATGAIGPQINLLNAHMFLENVAIFGVGNFTFNGISMYLDSANTQYYRTLLAGQYGDTSITINNIQFLFDTGNIVAGTISLYGISK